MKLRLNQWLSCGLAVLTLLGVCTPTSQINARRTTHRLTYRVAHNRYPYYQRRSQAGASIEQITSIPDQGYTNYVTGDHALYTLPGTVTGTRRLLTKSGVKKLANRNIRFMAYRKAITNRGSVYYKIVSQRHSVRGWIYQTDLRSILNRDQQAADLLVGPQIVNAEIKADESKHRSLANHTNVSLKSARRELRQATISAKVLKGTPDYAKAKQGIQQAYRYLSQVKAATPNSQTLNGLITIRTEYQQAAKAVNAAENASENHQNAEAKRDIKAANRSLRHVSRILSRIHNRRTRKAAMALFNQALSYVNTDYSFDPTLDLNGSRINSRKVSNKKLIQMIKKEEAVAQNSIMDLYPHLKNSDVTLIDAYRAQSALNRAQELVASLKGAHVQQAELNNIQQGQHNVNALWDV